MSAMRMRETSIFGREIFSHSLSQWTSHLLLNEGQMVRFLQDSQSIRISGEEEVDVIDLANGRELKGRKRNGEKECCNVVMYPCNNETNTIKSNSARCQKI